MTTALPRVFAAWFVDLKSWDVRSTSLRLVKTCHWPTVRLGSVSTIRFEMILNSDIKDGSVELLDRISFDAGEVHSGKRRETKMIQYRARPGDIVVSKINARKRAIGIVPAGTDIGITIHFRALEPEVQRVDSQFLWMALRSRFCTNQFESETGGIGKGEINESRLLDVEVPFPPLATQRAIVAEWENARAAIAAAEKNVRMIEADIESQFFTDLGLRIPNASAAPKFFAVHWTDFLRWSVSYNQTALTGLDLTRGSFPVAPLGAILDLVQYGTSEKANTRGQGVPVLRIGNIKTGVLDLSDLKHIDLPQRTLQGILLQDGDILIIRTSGSRDLVGTCAVFHETTSYVFASYLIRMRTSADKADPDFVARFINSALGRQQIDATSRQIMQNNINSQELRSLQIPLPPLTVQRKIMENVAAGRVRIARERETARNLAAKIETDMEAYLLGTKTVGVT